MAKRLKMNLGTDEVSELSGTDLLPHPGNFPLGSAESRAAARAVVASGRLRAGDQGRFKCGCRFVVVAKQSSRGQETGQTVQVILDVGELSAKHTHDYEVAG